MIPRRKSKVKAPPEVCPLTQCMQIIGGTWTPNIVWYLREGPRRFSELKSDISGISAKVLTARLKRLEHDGILTRHVMPTSPPTVEYELTKLGARLTPAIEAIVDVGHELKRVLR
jgi:DNA-binding HxlR family transcriptional regulator